MRFSVLLVVAWFTTATMRAESVDYNRDIKPILADKCYACHGPDPGQRQGGGEDGLRLDLQQEALADHDGVVAIVPGDPESSELVRRITSSDPYEVMPPREHRKRLTDREKQLLVAWVSEGASWSQHWAYTPPQPSPHPAVARGDHWIDALIRQKLKQRGLTASPPASKRVLVRRAFFDVIGLPPNPDQIDEFLRDQSDLAWENLVDRLLASPHFGERMAIYWLDLVRYADTVGYHGDQDVSVSPYRDYVINAFNTNMPFDQFTREQLAGDLLPNPTQDQLIASGYNKLGMMSAEGGAQPEEYLAKYASDRVRTASTVWMGSTLGCAECHDHKFDPFTQADFYRFAAFFADIQERGLYSGANRDNNWGPAIKVPDDQFADLVEPVDERIADLSRRYQQAEISQSQQEWESSWLQSDDASQLSPQAVEASATSKDSEDSGASKLPKNIRAVLATKASQRTADQNNELSDYYRSIAPELAEIRQELKAAKEQRAKIENTHTRRTLITKRTEPREIRVLPRGNWMDRSGKIVQPAVPHFLQQLDTPDRATRLDLANWLTSPDNPLTARVFVNRLWKMFFGSGLSKVLDDIGSQGEFPQHAELLDQLALEFVDSGWDIKRMIKLMLMTETYRQTSLMTDELSRLDPYNRWLARQSRFRIDAEMVRDNALAVSGLLVREVGGRSVKPYQPAGLLRHLNFPPRTYQHDRGQQQYRRGVYTHWQRQFLHPAMKSFDAPAREECTAERPRSNTPLAALVLLNDPSYVEAARVLAEDILQSEVASDRERVELVFRRSLGRYPSRQETQVLTSLIASQRFHFTALPEDAQRLISVGQRAVADDVDAVELASLLSATRAVFNMHEFITRN